MSVLLLPRAVRPVRSLATCLTIALLALPVATALPVPAACPTRGTCASLYASPGCATSGQGGYGVFLSSWDAAGQNDVRAWYACYDMTVMDWHIVGRIAQIDATTKGTPLGQNSASLTWSGAEVDDMDNGCRITARQDTVFTSPSSRDFGCPLGWPPVLP